MSSRLQVLITPELDARLRKAAQRCRVSKGEWVRRAIELSLTGDSLAGQATDPLARLAALDAPTADIGAMIAEIEQGQR